jgi:uncharacterized membrane protein (UPF0127 family)
LDSYKITLPNGIEIKAEVAKDKQKGLQERKSLCPDCGMIFIYEREGVRSFWIECEIYSSFLPAKYVLEVNPEAATGIKLGAKIKSEPSL